MKKKRYSHRVSIVMGSKSDYSTMKLCEKTLKLLKVNYETSIVSAHRTPERCSIMQNQQSQETLT